MFINKCLKITKNIKQINNNTTRATALLSSTSTYTSNGLLNLKQQQTRQLFTKIEQNELGIRYRFGKSTNKVLGPGLTLMIPYYHSIEIFDTRIFTQHIPKQTLITKDNVVISLDAMVSYKVIDPLKLVSCITNHDTSIKDLLLVKLIEIIPTKSLDQLIHKRDSINNDLSDSIKEQLDSWGIAIDSIHLKDLIFNQEISNAMGKKKEAEYLKDARLIIAESEFQSCQKIIEAASELEKSPMAIRLREIEALEHISKSDSKSFIFVPTSLFDSFSKAISDNINNNNKKKE